MWSNLDFWQQKLEGHSVRLKMDYIGPRLGIALILNVQPDSQHFVGFRNNFFPCI